VRTAKVNIMAFSVWKHVILMGRYLKTESFRTTQSDYSHRFGCSAPAKLYGMEIREAVQVYQMCCVLTLGSFSLKK
jgi:hypothetical protein